MSSIDDRFPTQAVPMTTVPDTEAETETRVAVGAEITKKGGGGLAWELLQTIVLTLAIFLGVRSVVQNFRVEGASMEPTLETTQYLLISKASYFHVEGTPLDRFLPTTHQGSTDYLFGGPQRGDVVVFKAPTQPDKDFIKRIIGLPGDTVLIKNGQVIVNGAPLDEAYIHYPATYTYQIRQPSQQIPDGNYFVLGDNHLCSSDSSRLGRAGRQPDRQGVDLLLAANRLGHHAGWRHRLRPLAAPPWRLGAPRRHQQDAPGGGFSSRLVVPVRQQCSCR